MGFENYLFAAFVFGLGVILVVILVKGLNKNRTERDLLWEAKEKKLEKMYAEITDLMDALESYLEENKEGLRREMEQVRLYLDDVKRIKYMEEPKKIETVEKKPAVEDTPAPKKGDLKQEALRLSRSGYSIGDIAEELGLSRGEVSFMLSLSKKSL
jgi:regulator of replication initiation timing